jgi:hypothetical protein
MSPKAEQLAAMRKCYRDIPKWFDKLTLKQIEDMWALLHAVNVAGCYRGRALERTKGTPS